MIPTRFGNPRWRLPAWVAAVLLLPGAAAPARAAAPDSRLVGATPYPSHPWESYPTRTLDDLPPTARAQSDGDLSRYGGRRDRKLPATGFFHTAQIDGRWWLVDPEGGLFLNKGVVAVTPGKTGDAREALLKIFGDEANWATRTAGLLRDHGFNGLGAWSNYATFRAPGRELVYTRIWDFMSRYGKTRGGTYAQPGHIGYPKDCIFVFDPKFATFCDEKARDLAADKDNPWLLGHFSDNELPWSRSALANYLALPVNDPGNQAALAWLRERHGPSATVQDITDEDRQAFLAFVVDRYFRIVSQAIKKYDPNHLFLGSRFYGKNMEEPVIFRAAGPYLDVVSVNYYHAWTPDRARMEMWSRESGKPILVTEFYAKGMDSGLPNKTGAGWLVKTQRDRGLFYQNYALGMLESKVCVGWHWFKYADNDPNDRFAEASNRDANKGIVSLRYEPYQPLMDAMRLLNERVYTLIDWFDRAGGR